MQKEMPKFKKDIVPRFPALSTIGVLGIVFVAIALAIAITLAIAINAFGAQGANAALVIAISYIIQVQSAAWYVKFTDIISGPPPEEATA